MNTEVLFSKFLYMESKASSVIESLCMPDKGNLWAHLRTCMHFYSAAKKIKCQNRLIKRNFDLMPGFYHALTRVPPQSCFVFTLPKLHTESVHDKLYDPYLDPVVQEADKAGLMPVKFTFCMDELDNALIAPLQLVVITTSQSFTSANEISPISGYYDYVGLAMEHGIPAIPYFILHQKWLNSHAYAKLFEKILAFVKPRMVILECYYNEKCMGLAKACRKLGIPCVEYQHGLQSFPHIPYCFEYIPKEGYREVPEWFFHWGEASAQAMEKYFAHQNFHKTLVAGKPNYVAWKRNALPEDPHLLRQFHEHIAGRIPLCVTLPVDEKGSLDMLEAAIANSPIEWLWLLRQHPLFPQAGIDELAARWPERVEVNCATRMRLFSVLDHCQHMITEISSAALEAASLFNIEVTCTSPSAKQYFASSFTAGAMRYADTAETLIHSVAQGLANFPNPVMNGVELTQDISLLGAALKHVARAAKGEVKQI